MSPTAVGGLVQRVLDGSSEVPEPDELIQFHYPYLSDTIEVLQVRRVLQRWSERCRRSFDEFQSRCEG